MKNTRLNRHEGNKNVIAAFWSFGGWIQRFGFKRNDFSMKKKWFEFRFPQFQIIFFRPVHKLSIEFYLGKLSTSSTRLKKKFEVIVVYGRMDISNFATRQKNDEMLNSFRIYLTSWKAIGNSTPVDQRVDSFQFLWHRPNVLQTARDNFTVKTEHKL